MKLNIVENGVELSIKKGGGIFRGKSYNGRTLKLLEAYSEESPTLCWVIDENRYFIAHDLLAKLSDYEIMALNLPRSIPYDIYIDVKGDLGSKTYSVKWRIYEGKQTRFFKREGALLVSDNETYRLPHEIFQIFKAIDNHNENKNPTFDDNVHFSAELKSLLPEGGDYPVKIDDYLSRIQLKHASAFSLKVEKHGNSIDFAPVLFNKRTRQKATESDYLIEEDEQILSEDEVYKFLAEFDVNDKVKPTYLLGAGSYLYIDKSLRPALKIAKKAKSLNENEKREFLKSPQKYIKAAFKNDLPDDDIEKELFLSAIDELFIETRQYSERVIDIGIWTSPPLPWLSYEPKEWVDGKYHFYVQGKISVIEKHQLRENIEKLKDALDSGAEKVHIGRVDIKPEESFLATLNALLPEKPKPYKKPPATTKPYESGGDPPEQNQIFVLKTKANFETIEYNARFKTRAPNLGGTLPKFFSEDTQLKPHQKIGLNWLVETYNRGFPGVLMADDMGLGKTLQALAFLSVMVEADKTREGNPILIVAPVGLLKNWQEEHDKHLTGQGLGNFAKLYGQSLNAFKIQSGKDIDIASATLDTEELKRCDWLLTTYETVRDYQISLGEIKFSCVVFDECQKIKNPRSLVSNGVKALNKDFSIGLTGTPVENSLADLWTIMDVLSPGRLKNLKTFIKEYPDLTSENQEEALKKSKELAAELLKPAHNGPPPVLRRMKSELPDDSFPKKQIAPSIEMTLCMPDEQEEAYIDVSNKKNSGQMPMIEALQLFRKVSLHPINPAQREPEKYSNDDFINTSARFKKTFEILDQIKKRKEKALIFLESLAMQPLLADIIAERYQLQSRPLIINGAVTGDARQRKVHEFQQSDSDFDVMIISPKAGGVGLTLTAANNVIHLERWWNPAVEDQCTDRTYRIGQTRDVNVYTPIAESKSFGSKSFDCILDELLKKKRMLAKGLFIPTKIDSQDRGWSNIFQSEQDEREWSLEDIDCLETGKDFERFVQDLIKRHGLKATLTQTSYDYGADLIVENEKTGKIAILQCKHRSSKDKAVSKDAIDEVSGSTKYYPHEKPKLFVVSNATKLADSAKLKMKSSNVEAILRDQLLNIGKIMKNHLS